MERGRKGGQAFKAKREQAKTMRELAEYYGGLAVKKGTVKLPKTANKEDQAKANPTLDALVIAAMYNKAVKGDTRAAEFLAKLKGQTADDVTVHIDQMADMDTADLLALYDKTKGSDD